MNNETKPLDELDLIEVIRVILKNRRLIITIVTISAIAAVVYSLLTPQIWQSEASFYALSDKGTELAVTGTSMNRICRTKL